MPRFLVIVPACILVTRCWSQWAVIAEPPTAVFDVYALNADTVIVAADFGTIMRSTDGGDSWSSFQTPFVWQWFYDIDFPSLQVGYICGGANFAQQCVAKTIDGGVTWDTLNNTDFSSGTIDDIEFLNEDTGFALDGYAPIRTLDGGSSFAGVPVGSYVYCGALAFQDATTGFMAASHWLGGMAVEYNILRTHDALATWDTVYSYMGTNLQNERRTITRMQFVDAQRGFAIGLNGTFLRTVDGGETWTYSVIPPGSAVTDVFFITPTTGWVANGHILRTDDGGETWEEQQQDTMENVQRLHMVDQNVGYAVAYHHIFKTGNGSGYTSVAEHDASAGLLLHPNPTSGKLIIRYSGQGPILGSHAVDMIGRCMPLEIYDGRAADLSAWAEGRYAIIVRTTKEVLHGTVVITR